MSALTDSALLWAAATVALAIACARLASERRRDPAAPLPGGALALAALAASCAAPGHAARAALIAGLAVALLAHDRRDRLHGECGLKLLWVLGTALALSWLGVGLLVVATGTRVAAEQWAVLALGLEPRFLWSVALPLSLIGGLVLLGGAPFHFWLADLHQGARDWLAPVTSAALQVAGARWVAWRVTGIEGFPAGEAVAGGLLRIAAEVAFLAAAATLPTQLCPERRVGTLASLQGALLLAGIAALHGRPGFEPEAASLIARWSAHLLLALSGAALLARFLPVHGPDPVEAAPLFRRHRIAAVAGAFAAFSMAGVPGTPGGLLWLEVARALARAGHTAVLATLAAGWLVAFAIAVRQARDGFGIPAPGPAPAPTPLSARASLLAPALALVALGVEWLAR